MWVQPSDARAAIDSGACAAGKAAVGLAGVAAGGCEALRARKFADAARHALRSQHALSFWLLSKGLFSAETLGLF